MRFMENPRQNALFDPAEKMFSHMTLKYLRGDWPGLFRAQMLHLMPAAELGEHFDPKTGCPTKDLYAMAGMIFLKEFFHLTIEQTVARFLTDAAFQYALNVNPMEVSLSHATVERYQKLFVENELGAAVFDRVTTALVQGLELDVSRQRLDSTHIKSDMASFGRTKLMGVTIKRFLTQLKRHERALYAALPESLRARYARSAAKLFGDWGGGRRPLRQSVAEELLFLVSRFAEHEAVARRTCYKAMRRVLEEQCDVVEETVSIKKKTGGGVMQNPSDPDAGYDGHKGQGYQAQIAETCSPENEVQLITAVAVEPAHHSDQAALSPMLDQLDKTGRLPEALYTDTGYGGDENVVQAAARGVDLQSPVSGNAPQNAETLTVDDFVIDEASERVERCPAGHTPKTSEHNPKSGTTTTVMNTSDCAGCPFLAQCPVRKIHGRFALKHTAKARRLAARRAEQETEAFRENYAIRSGGESVNSGLKRRTGMGRLRVRGSPAMGCAVLLRCAGWNIFRAMSAYKKRGIRDFRALKRAFSAFAAANFVFGDTWERTDGLFSPFSRFPNFSLVAAA